MKLVDPFALIFLISIPLIILMYLLKQTFEVKEISSTYLWEQVLKDIEVNAPWQKLKRNILLILQLIIALLIVFSMAKPFLLLNGKAYDNVILVIDNSGSMNAKFNEKTKLDEAKERAEKLIKSLKSGSKITLITSGKDTKVELSAVTDKTMAIAKVKGIEKSDFSGNINDSLSLVKSIAKQYQNYKAVFYTDESMSLKDINGEVQNIHYPSDNVSLDYISQVKDNNGLKVLVRINNRSNKAEKRELCLYGDEKILDIKDVELAPAEVKTVYFDGISENVSYLKAEISEKDGLLEDNDIYSVIKSQGVKKVLLVSNKNVFIEKALSNIKGIELYKANSADTNINGYDLYIFDGIYPKQLPARGSILAINPTKDNPLVKTKGIIKGGQGGFLKNAITDYTGDAQINVAELEDLELPYWGDGLIEINKKPAAYAGDINGRKVGVIAFDLHKSDFPLISAYPIFMNNIISYLVDLDNNTKDSYLSGEAIDINPSPDSKELIMENNFGKEERLELKFPIRPYEKTNSTGIYKLIEKSGDKSKQTMFSVNFPTNSESNINKDIKSTENNIKLSKTGTLGIDMQPLLIIAILIIAVAEWMVYVYGY